jgi:6-pyruvoyltetrahydropterin/6-carboxytetrahydropterin synthase
VSYRVRLAKQDFKFSVAHLTLLADGGAERLHGHDYTIAVEVEGDDLDETGLLIDVARLKEQVRKACARLDEHVLLPEASPVLGLEVGPEQVELRVAARCYRIPRRDVILLPIRNVSMELLAKLLFEELAPGLRGSRAIRMAIEVSETPGQSARYDARIG